MTGPSYSRGLLAHAGSAVAYNRSAASKILCQSAAIVGHKGKRGFTLSKYAPKPRLRMLAAAVCKVVYGTAAASLVPASTAVPTATT